MSEAVKSMWIITGGRLGGDVASMMAKIVKAAGDPSNPQLSPARSIY
jgi:hypothetical protein